MSKDERKKLDAAGKIASLKAANPAKIANECSPTHIKNVIEDLVSELVEVYENGIATDDMRSAVRFAPSSAYWSDVLRNFFGDDARTGICALEAQIWEKIGRISEMEAQIAALHVRLSSEVTRTDAAELKLKTKG